MSPKKGVNLANLEALGAKRLAELLFELASADAGIKRRLRLELSANVGAETVAADISKRLSTLRKARSFVDWQKRPAFVKDLHLQRRLIVEKVAADRPGLALDLLWRFMELAEPVLNWVDDSRGDVGDAFTQACQDLGAVAQKASPDPERLTERVVMAVTTNDYGEYDDLVEAILPALAGAGVARLKERLTAELERCPATNRNSFDSKRAALQRALRTIADHEGDVDAFIAHETGRDSAQRAAAIATRLLAADRAEEALAFLNRATPRTPEADDFEDDWLFSIGGAGDEDWDQAWVAALLATGRHDEAQRFRWSRFEASLNAARLRAYLKALPDFEDVVAEQKALDHALGFRHFAAALNFLVEWPALRQTGRLVRERTTEIDGNLYFILGPAAETLAGKEPLAAVLLHRAMIEDTLAGAKATRYRHAARHLLACRALEAAIGDSAGFETHEAFVAKLEARHGRKVGFWSRVRELVGVVAGGVSGPPGEAI